MPRMTKVTFLCFVNVRDHKMYNELPLDVMFENYHPFTCTEISVLSNSEHVIDPDIQIKVGDKYAGLWVGPYRNSFTRFNIKVNGVNFWQLAGDPGRLELSERDIIEISLIDKEKDTLTHIIIVITGFVR